MRKHLLKHFARRRHAKESQHDDRQPTTGGASAATEAVIDHRRPTNLVADELHPEERLRLAVVQLEEISQAAGNAAEAGEEINGGRAKVIRGSVDNYLRQRCLCAHRQRKVTAQMPCIMGTDGPGAKRRRKVHDTNTADPPESEDVLYMLQGRFPNRALCFALSLETRVFKA